MEIVQDFSHDLTKSLERTLNFVQNQHEATRDIDLLIVIQTFVQQITLNLSQHLDPSMSDRLFYFNFKIINYFDVYF